MKYVLSVVAWTTGALGCCICVPLMIAAAAFLKPRGYNPVGRLITRVLLASFFVLVRARGLERVDPKAPHLFMANHSSFFDFFILAAYLPGFSRGLEAAEHFSWPVWGLFLRKVGMLPADRSSAAASMRSMKHAAEKIREEGMSILILPEGTRTLTGRMLPFKRLPFYIAKEAGCDIVPIGIKGTFRIKNKSSWLIRPGRADIIFGDPVDVQTVGEKSPAELAELTRDRIAVILDQPAR